MIGVMLSALITQPWRHPFALGKRRGCGLADHIICHPGAGREDLGRPRGEDRTPLWHFQVDISQRGIRALLGYVTYLVRCIEGRLTKVIRPPIFASI